MIEIHDKAFELIKKKYNILFSIDCRDFDLDYTVLQDLINKIKKDKFDPKDRILIVHMDTDYYDSVMPCGLLPLNLIRILKDNFLPMYLLLFVTNHYGIKKEFDLILQNQPKEDYPTIVETLLSKLIIAEKIPGEQLLNLNNIKIQGLCMMGKARSHRIALCNFITKHLSDKIALQTNFDCE